MRVILIMMIVSKSKGSVENPETCLDPDVAVACASLSREPHGFSKAGVTVCFRRRMALPNAKMRRVRHLITHRAHRMHFPAHRNVVHRLATHCHTFRTPLVCETIDVVSRIDLKNRSEDRAHTLVRYLLT